MTRIDIPRLRKTRGMSQGELAQLLQIPQSFLSAIENGKSPLPPEKESKLLEIFKLDSFKEFMTGPQAAVADSPTSSFAGMTEGELFNQLLSRFHEHAHRNDQSGESHHDHHERIAVLEERNDRLMLRNDQLLERNDRLSAENDRLREEIDSLRAEIFRLRTGK